MFLNRRVTFGKFIGIFLLGFFATFSAKAEDALASVQQYMSGMKSASGRFVQVGPDGVISTGKFGLRRPGKMSFDYDAPTPLRVAADGFWTVVEDKKLGTQDRYPLSETPLKLILDTKTDYRNSPYVQNVEEDANTVRINAQDPDRPETGKIQIVFERNPMQLKQWTVTDPQGLQTVVTLQNVVLNPTLPNAMFYIENSLKK